MNWLDKFERRFGRLGINNLMMYIVMLNVFVFCLTLMDRSGSLIYKLVLIPSEVMRGEIWRVITFIFIPPSFSMLWIIFTLYFYYIAGTGLEQEWGTFKFNVYYFTGMIGTIIASLVSGHWATPLYLNLSLFLAFARIYPNFELLLFFVLPVKIKYLAWIQCFFIGLLFIIGSTSSRIFILVSIANYFIFFARDIIAGTKNTRRNYHNRKSFRSSIPKDITIHRCTVCGKTEKDDSKLEFRYCSQCEGDYEYCMEHLKDHDHIKGEVLSGKE